MKHILWGIPIAALFLAPVANADEQGYLDQLDQYQIPYNSPEAALTAGNLTCQEVRGGMDYYKTVYHMGIGTENLTISNSDRIVTAAITELCPQYVSIIPK